MNYKDLIIKNLNILINKAYSSSEKMRFLKQEVIII